MRNIYQRYVKESFWSDGQLDSFYLNVPGDFNWAYDIVDDIGSNEPERKAMIWCDPEGNERVFTFGEIKRLSDKTANYLSSLGIKKGDKVLVVLQRHYEFWYVAPALIKLGAVLVPATFMLKPHDLEYRIQAAGLDACIVSASCAVPEGVDEVAPLCPTLKTKIIVHGEREGWESFDAGVEAASETWTRVPTTVREPMIMYFSSGTAGYPKMVLHDHSYALAHLFTARHWHNITPDSLCFTIADTGWGKAVWGKLFGQWIMEACVLVYDFLKFKPAEILSTISKYRVTNFCCPPTMYRMLLTEDVKQYDLSALRYCNTAGEAMAPEIFETWRKATGHVIMEGFGQTESIVTLCNLPGSTPKPGSLGKPAPQFKVRLIDADCNPVEPGSTGEIAISLKKGKPDGIMVEYYRDAQRTEEAFRGGYYHTGDLAWMDEDGYYWYVGRNDDVIKSSGYRIGPFEIESVLMEHPAIAECAVTGIPDPVRGQLVKATIVLFPGVEGTEELKKEIQVFVKDRTAPYKYPRVIEFVEELPKTSNGKVRRTAIREADAKRMADEAAAGK